MDPWNDRFEELRNNKDLMPTQAAREQDHGWKMRRTKWVVERRGAMIEVGLGEELVEAIIESATRGVEESPSGAAASAVSVPAARPVEE